jgi:hypothetical protein
MKKTKNEAVTASTIIRLVDMLTNKGISTQATLFKDDTVISMSTEQMPLSIWAEILEEYTVEISCEAADGKYTFALAGGLDFIAVGCTEKSKEIPCMSLRKMDRFVAAMQPSDEDVFVAWTRKLEKVC